MPNEIALAEIKVIETKPAVVNFNYDEIAAHLETTLTKYTGLVFTESAATECKKTIAELRKGQKALDTFRKNTKKQLTESVTAFENQCKQLHTKFEEVIQPLTGQYDQFEMNRRERKLAEIRVITDALISELGLSEKYALQLDLPEDYFNKGKTLKAIKAELAVKASTLKVQQDKEDQDIDLIKTKVELANAHYQLTNILMSDPYVRLLSSNTVSEIEEVINSDAQKLHERENIAKEVVATQVVNAPSATEVIAAHEPVKPTEVFPAGVFCIAEPVTREPITAVYEITGTEEQLTALETYLDANNLKWIDRPNE